MNLDEKIGLLIRHIKGLRNLEFVKPEIQVPYNHMGATIIDAMLQAGTTWKTVVKPRIEKLLTYSEAKTTTGFHNLISKVGIKDLLNWTDDEKPNRISKAVYFFLEEGIETEADLKNWLCKDTNIPRLKQLRGVGNKTADYFKILAGIPTSAIDRHLIEFLRKAGIEIDLNDYTEAREIINRTADKMGIDRSLLDHSIWKNMSDKKSNRKICRGGHYR